jgi:hypothetical protein
LRRIVRQNRIPLLALAGLVLGPCLIAAQTHDASTSHEDRMAPVMFALAVILAATRLVEHSHEQSV